MFIIYKWTNKWTTHMKGKYSWSSSGLTPSVPPPKRKTRWVVPSYWDRNLEKSFKRPMMDCREYWNSNREYNVNTNKHLLVSTLVDVSLLKNLCWWCSASLTEEIRLAKTFSAECHMMCVLSSLVPANIVHPYNLSLIQNILLKHTSFRRSSNFFNATVSPPCHIPPQVTLDFWIPISSSEGIW